MKKSKQEIEAKEINMQNKKSKVSKTTSDNKLDDKNCKGSDEDSKEDERFRDAHSIDKNIGGGGSSTNVHKKPKSDVNEYSGLGRGNGGDIFIDNGGSFCGDKDCKEKVFFNETKSTKDKKCEDGDYDEGRSQSVGCSSDQKINRLELNNHNYKKDNDCDRDLKFENIMNQIEFENNSADNGKNKKNEEDSIGGDDAFNFNRKSLRKSTTYENIKGNDDNQNNINEVIGYDANNKVIITEENKSVKDVMMSRPSNTQIGIDAKDNNLETRKTPTTYTNNNILTNNQKLDEYHFHKDVNQDTEGNQCTNDKNSQLVIKPILSKKTRPYHGGNFQR